MAYRVAVYNAISASGLARLPAPHYAVGKALASPDVQGKYRGLGIHAEPSTPQEMHDRLARDIAKWRDVIDKAGIPKQ